MVKTLLALLEFKSPYHVGWRVVESIIEGFTLHRALIHTSILIEGQDVRVDEVCRLRVSAALPTVQVNDCNKLLLPLPNIPSRVGLKKVGIRWATAKSLSLLIKLLDRGIPIITDVVNDVETNKIRVELNGIRMELCYEKGIIYDCFEGLDKVLKEFKDPLVKVERYVNRLDRATNAADIYKISGYIPTTKLGVLIQGEDNVVDYGYKLLKLLGELGIGGFRSRGFGRYYVEVGRFCEDQLVSHDRGPGHLIVLGSYVFSDSIDLSSSIVNRKLISGYAGPPYDSYKLPHMSYIGSGSIIKAKETLKDVVWRIENSRSGSLLVFNPVTMR